MTPTTLKSYTKDELLAILSAKCPDALAKFPPPEDFEIKINQRRASPNEPGMVDSPAVPVGHSKTRKPHKKMGDFWLEQYDPDEDKILEYASPDRPDRGAEARDARKLHEPFKGLYYTANDDVNVNGYIKNANGFVGNTIFSKLGTAKNGGVVASPFGHSIKALLRFILLHCGRADVFKEYLDEKNKVQGIGALARVLNAMAKRMKEAEKVEVEVEQEDEEDDWDGLSVKEGSGKKRAREDDGGEIGASHSRMTKKEQAALVKVMIEANEAEHKRLTNLHLSLS
jgi:hypothetical protein